MRKEEFKKKIVNKINSLIDVYYGENTIVDKMANSTLKIFVDTNLDKVDGVLNSVSDENGEIDAEKIVSKYSCNVPESGINIDIRDYIKNNFIIGLLPNKSLNITKDDFEDILK